MLTNAEHRLVLLRFAGEVFIKSKRTRSAFLQRLRANLEDALSSVDAEARVESGWDRMYVHYSDDVVLEVLPRVFGISSFSPVDRVVSAELDAIVEAGAAEFTEAVRGRTFAVRARRAGSHPFRSKDVMVQLGSRLLDASAGVDLDDPEAEVFVEVRGDSAYLFSRRIPGAGGLPLGVEGRAITLLSGGYDSAVAAWLLLKRGITQDFVFCNLGGDAYERSVLQVGKVLADDWSYGYRPRLHVIDFDEPLRALRSSAREKYWQVVLKRLMYRAASQVAEELGGQAIVTGEAVGQVSSQTLANLRAIEPAAELPVFRPLLGFDKEEIIDRARVVGTAGLSSQVKEYCAIAPGRPVTAATVEAVEEEESKVDRSSLDGAITNRKVLDLRSLTATDLVAPYLYIEDVPDDAIVLDCRAEPAFAAWHFPGAEQRDEWELLRKFKKLDRDRRYVLYCAHGIQTANVAEKMQRSGYEAYSFRGGVKGIREWAEEQQAEEQQAERQQE